MHATALVSYVVTMRLPGSAAEIPLEIQATEATDLEHAIALGVITLQERYSPDVAKDSECIRAYTVHAIKELVLGEPTDDDIAEAKASEAMLAAEDADKKPKPKPDDKTKSKGKDG